MFTSLNHLTDDNMNGVVDCAWYSFFCRTTAFFVQASAMFSEMISFMITVDLLVAINNPFSGIQQGIRRAVVVATAMSLITAFTRTARSRRSRVVVRNNESEGLIEWSPGTPGWGPENAVQVCWYSFVGAGKANPNSICLYFSWILLSIVVSVISVPSFNVASVKGYRKTFSVRSKSLRSSPYLYFGMRSTDHSRLHLFVSLYGRQRACFCRRDSSGALLVVLNLFVGLKRRLALSSMAAVQRLGGGKGAPSAIDLANARIKSQIPKRRARKSGSRTQRKKVVYCKCDVSDEVRKRI